MRRFFCLTFLLLCAAVASQCEDAVEVTVCQLKNNPPAYNRKLVRVTGFVSHAFEDFSLSDPSCPEWPGVWLEYGGTSKSGTMYCCGVRADRTRPKELTIEDIAIPLIKDDRFKDFDKAIQPPFRSGKMGAVIHATLMGRYFAGKQVNYLKDKPWGGFGHMGCCTLLAIQQVISADTENRSGLDYGAEPEQPDIAKIKCGYQMLLPLQNTDALMKWQRESENKDHDWAFDDPARVATFTLARLANVDAAAALQNMKLTHEAQGRKVYQWKPGEEDVSYMVVVSRPYFLSFYSRDPKRVAWAAIAAYRSSCGSKNPVTRLK